MKAGACIVAGLVVLWAMGFAAEAAARLPLLIIGPLALAGIVIVFCALLAQDD